MHPHARHAVRAAHNYHRWGRSATVRYCTKRGVPVSLLGLALMLYVQGVTL
jgi:hypothetical protein